MRRHDRNLIRFYLPPAAAAAAGLFLVLAGVVQAHSLPGGILLALGVPVTAAAAITAVLLRSRKAL